MSSDLTLDFAHRPPRAAPRSRREFLRSALRSTAAVAALGTPALRTGHAAALAGAAERIRVAQIGCGGMGRNDMLAMALSGMAEVVAACDPHEDQAGRAAAELERRELPRPRLESDFRRILDRADIDAVSIGTPDHWHAPIAILACEAGKDVYVEKPCAHTLAEGAAMVRAATATGRVVQVGTQLRSSRIFETAVEFVRSGQLGPVHLGKAWTIDPTAGLGHPADEPPPEGLDFDLWLGPAPERPFNRARFHVNWRYFWDYGEGHFADIGVHLLDILRWALALDRPLTVAASGGKYVIDDSAETPDTVVAAWEFPGVTLHWEHRQWGGHPPEGRGRALGFYGTTGYLVADYGGWQARAYDGEALLGEQAGGLEHARHVENFLQCVKDRTPPRADLATVHWPTTRMVLAGVLAQRLGRKLAFDAAAAGFVDDAEANRLRHRHYRGDWGRPVARWTERTAAATWRD